MFFNLCLLNIKSRQRSVRLELGKHNFVLAPTGRIFGCLWLQDTELWHSPLSVCVCVIYSSSPCLIAAYTSRLQALNAGLSVLLLLCLARSLSHPLVSTIACDLTFLGDAHPNALPPFLSASTRETSRVLRHGGLVLKEKCKFPLSEGNGNESRGRHFFIYRFFPPLLTVALTCLFNCMAALFCCPSEEGFTHFYCWSTY